MVAHFEHNLTALLLSNENDIECSNIPAAKLSKLLPGARREHA